MARRSICAGTCVVALALLATGQVATAEDIGALLDMTPVSLEPYGSLHSSRQALMYLDVNLERLYGVGCVLELPTIGRERTERYPSAKLDYVPIEISENTTLREFLDHACSEGQIQWEAIHGAIHIRPAVGPTDKPNYLDDVRVSLDLEGASLLDALRAWGLAVNQHTAPSDYGVGVIHPCYGAGAHQWRDRATPASLTRPGAVTVNLESVTAREALCAIQGASREWVRIGYQNKRAFRDNVTMFASRAEHMAALEVTTEERLALDAAEQLGAELIALAKEQQE